ncbi:hypothetical protein BGZ46_007856 [Entomortierella lignicola]|nr:hypothetical protein BGZ46_007856 [Entomortierella lignicola]
MTRTYNQKTAALVAGLFFILVGLSCFLTIRAVQVVSYTPASSEIHLKDKRQSTDHDVHRAHLYLADKVFDDVENLLDSPDLDSCQMCQQGMRMAQNFSQQAPELVPGVLRRLGFQLAGIFSEMNLNGSDGYYACAYAFPGACPLPVHQPSPITFPKPKPENARQPAPSGETIQVLHFSDWHIDPLYQVGAEAKCSHNICCRDFGSWNDPGPIKKPASKWGDGRCDTPIDLGLNALQAITRFVPNATFGLFTGDIISHDSWMITEKYIGDEERKSYELFKQYLKEMKLYVVMGNHDSYPSDQAPGRMRPDSYITHKWLYDHVAGIWEQNNWITSSEADYVRSHNAMFITRPLPGLKLITLNTDLYYVRNYFTMLDTDIDDPSGVFHDLILELQDSEDRNERGHFHQDKFVVLHDPDALEQSEESAVNVVYEGPSITPLDKSNPAIRWYDIDAKTFSVLNTHTVIADIITQAAYWEANGLEPEWKHEYSARETYDDPEDPLPLEEPLSPAFWHRAVERMKGDRILFETYLQLESKSSADADPCHKGSPCEKASLCQMQASTVIEHEACEEEAGLHPAKKKKPSKKERFSLTRAGRLVNKQDYDKERGILDNHDIGRRNLEAHSTSKIEDL